jgi:hypothetical protein
MQVIVVSLYMFLTKKYRSRKWMLASGGSGGSRKKSDYPTKLP